jgi:hypothetical protein
MTDIEKKVKNASQDLEAKINTEEDHANYQISVINIQHSDNIR